MKYVTSRNIYNSYVSNIGKLVWFWRLVYICMIYPTFDVNFSNIIFRNKMIKITDIYVSITFSNINICLLCNKTNHFFGIIWWEVVLANCSIPRSEKCIIDKDYCLKYNFHSLNFINEWRSVGNIRYLYFNYEYK